jgi:FkbM family methyltransferase
MLKIDRSRVKSVLRSCGVYSLARHVYRRVDPNVRRARVAERQFYRRLINEGDLCFDVGANLGQTVESWINANVRIIAVEPNPFCVQTIRWEFGGDPNVTIVEQAVGSTTGFADLHFEGTDATGSLREDWPFPNRMVRRVPVTTLDELIARFGRPRLCKIDVEGYEVEVFKGLSQPIPIITFEFHGNEVARALECLARLEAIGTIQAASVVNAEMTGYLSENVGKYRDLVALLSAAPAEHGNIVVQMET